MRAPLFTIIVILLLAGNSFGAYKLFTEGPVFMEKYPGLTPERFQIFKWLPVVNILSLVGLLFWQRWGAWLAIACGLAVITCDIFFGIKYHLYVAVPSTLILTFFIIRFWHQFNK